MSDIVKLQAQVTELRRWRDAVIDQLVVAHIYNDTHDADPRKAIRDLLEWTSSVALDPLVCYEARALVEQGRQEAGTCVFNNCKKK